MLFYRTTELLLQPTQIQDKFNLYCLKEGKIATFLFCYIQTRSHNFQACDTQQKSIHAKHSFFKKIL